MLIDKATIVRRAERMNSDIQTDNVLSHDPVVGCCPRESLGDEFTDMVLVTVIALDVAEIVTTVSTVAVVVSDCISVVVLVVDVMVVDVAMMSCVLVTTDIVLKMLVEVVAVTKEVT